MEEILFNLGGFSVTPHPNNPNAEHPRFSQYKIKNSGSSQDERRKKILEARKEARYDVLNHLRNIEENIKESDGTSSDDSMECDQEYACYRKPKRYRNFIMLSEWLVDVPDNFSTHYLAVPCPVGARTLVVSCNGRTRSYSKSGTLIKQFPSLLPGGSRHNNSYKGYALLDCIWSAVDKTFYILDLIVWLNQSIMESETIFRFEWLKSRIEEEVPGVKTFSRINPYRFLPVPYYNCTTESLTHLLSNEQPLPFTVPLDGMLFYHNQSHYTHGPTPLVGWLKAFMVPEILGVPVADKYMNERPAKYVNLPVHIQHKKECYEIITQKRNEERKNLLEVTIENTKRDGIGAMEISVNTKKRNNRRKNRRQSKDGTEMELVNNQDSEAVSIVNTDNQFDFKSNFEFKLQGTGLEDKKIDSQVIIDSEIEVLPDNEME